MKPTIYTIIIIFTVIVFANLEGQECSGLFKSVYCEIPNAKGFKQYGQARNATLEIRVPYTFQAVLLGKKEYKIRVCIKPILEPILIRVKDTETDKILYDNSTDNNSENFSITVEKTKSILIEITAVAKDINPKDFIDIRVCGGIQILWKDMKKVSHK